MGSGRYLGRRQSPCGGRYVLIRTGHRVVYGGKSEKPFRAIHVAGTLAFDPDRDTCSVGLIKIQPGDDATEEGFDCDAHVEAPKDGDARRRSKSARRRTDPQDRTHSPALLRGDGQGILPAIVCCGGRMDFHGAPLSRTWVKLGATAKTGDTAVTLAEPVTGWKVGDRVIVTAHADYTDDGKDAAVAPKSASSRPSTARKLTLDKPLEIEHLGDGDYRGEVANLSRNVVVESADPDGVRGHTMYHRDSAGSISYAEFRHLGKEGVLGRYSLHFHLCRRHDARQLRRSAPRSGTAATAGSPSTAPTTWSSATASATRASATASSSKTAPRSTTSSTATWPSAPARGKPLPKQVLPFDENDGAGFWWANSLNTFTRNVAAENDHYGFRFEATQAADFKLDPADPAARRQQEDGRYPHAAVRPLRGQRSAQQRRPVRRQPRRGRQPRRPGRASIRSSSAT